MSLNAYKELRVLAEHDAVRTSLAEDEDGQRVVLRTLSLRAATSHEEVELFERESAVLEHLDHPRLPRILARERDEDGDDVLLHQVRAFVDGKSLFEEIEGGRHLTEREALTTALSVADTLAFLHERSPPLVHRDLKPQNLIRTSDDALDAQSVTVIDLGAIKAGPSTGRTIVGTYGYMPPEQFEGRSSPASDVFALGMTLIYLLTHKEPGEFDDGGAREHFKKEANVSPAAAALIEEMIAYDPTQRPKDGAALASRLREVINPRAAAPAVSPDERMKTRRRRSAAASAADDDDRGEQLDNAASVVMVVVLLGFALIGGVASLWRGAEDEPQPPTVVEVPTPPLTPSAPEAPPRPAQVLGFDEHDRHLLRCAARLFPRLLQSERRYLSWVSEGGPTGKERHIYGLYRGYDDAKMACPVDPELGRFAARALDLVAEASRYYDEEDYRDDDFQHGRELHPKLLRVFEELRDRETKAIEHFTALVEQLEPIDDDPRASGVRKALRQAWDGAFKAGDEPITSATALRALELDLASTLAALASHKPHGEVIRAMALDLEQHRRHIKQLLREGERQRPPSAEKQAAELRAETLELLSSLELVERTHVRYH